MKKVEFQIDIQESGLSVARKLAYSLMLRDLGVDEIIINGTRYSLRAIRTSYWRRNE